jgi:hypothetical protein
MLPVEIIPAERESFVRPQPGKEQHRQEATLPTNRRIKQRAHLVVVKRINFRFLLSQLGDVSGRIVGDELAPGATPKMVRRPASTALTLRAESGRVSDTGSGAPRPGEGSLLERGGPCLRIPT